MYSEVVHQGTPEGAVRKFRICGSLMKMQAVMHCHIKQVKYPPESQIETEMALWMPF